MVFPVYWMVVDGVQAGRRDHELHAELDPATTRRSSTSRDAIHTAVLLDGR